MVMAPASTGRDRSNRIAVIKTDHTKSGILSIDVFEVRMLIVVVIKFTAPRMEDAPAKCNLKIAISTLVELWYIQSDKGG